MGLFSALRRSPEEFGREMRLITAIHWYTRSDVSMEKAAIIAGLNRRDFLLELAARKAAAFKVDAEAVADDIGPVVARSPSGFRSGAPWGCTSRTM